MVVFAIFLSHASPSNEYACTNERAIPNRSPGISLTSAESYSAQSEQRRGTGFVEIGSQGTGGRGVAATLIQPF